MARPKAFNRDQALRTAMLLFWKKGYEATSTDDLVRAMEIGRQSLYDTFDDKHSLYIEALQLYNSEQNSKHAKILLADVSPLAAIEALLCSVVGDELEVQALGCMNINAVCEFGQRDRDVTALEKASHEELLSHLERTLHQAKENGEVAPDLDVKKAARFLSTTFTGLKVRARAGDDAEALRSDASLAVDCVQNL
jgi:TetR/AcrR family transcriptional repressor of nem operon